MPVREPACRFPAVPPHSYRLPAAQAQSSGALAALMADADEEMQNDLAGWLGGNPADPAKQNAKDGAKVGGCHTLRNCCACFGLPHLCCKCSALGVCASHVMLSYALAEEKEESDGSATAATVRWLPFTLTLSPISALNRCRGLSCKRPELFPVGEAGYPRSPWRLPVVAHQTGGKGPRQHRPPHCSPRV